MRTVKHIALLKFKPGTSDKDIHKIFTSIGDLKNVIPGILDYNWGPYSSDEGLNQGYTHGFIMTFDNASSRDKYLPHPEHEKVKNSVFPFIEAVVVFDFEV